MYVCPNRACRTQIYTEFAWTACDQVWLSAPREKYLLEFIYVILQRSERALSRFSSQKTRHPPETSTIAFLWWALREQFLWNCRQRYVVHYYIFVVVCLMWGLYIPQCIESEYRYFAACDKVADHLPYSALLILCFLTSNFPLAHLFHLCLQFTRDWFLTRFRLLAEDILVDQERLSRRFKIWERARQLNPVETQSVAKLQGLLERGIQVLHHELSGKIVEAVLRYSSVSNDLQLFSRHDGIFMSKETVMVSYFLLLGFKVSWRASVP